MFGSSLEHDQWGTCVGSVDQRVGAMRVFVFPIHLWALAWLTLGSGWSLSPIRYPFGERGVVVMAQANIHVLAGVGDA